MMRKETAFLGLRWVIALVVIGMLIVLSPSVAWAQAPVDEQPAGQVDSDEPEGVDWIAIIVERLGISEDELFDALADGQSIADVARSKGVDPEALVDAIVAAESVWIDELVARGELIEEEAAALKEEIRQFAVEFVYEEGIEVIEPEEVDWFAIVEEVLGLSEDELCEALADGRSLADVARDRGMDPEALVDAIVAAERAWIDDLVADGSLTAEEAEEWIAEIREFAVEFVNEPWEESGVDWISIAAEKLGLGEDELLEMLDSGKSIADVARSRGLEPQSIVDAIVAAEQAWVDGLVADGSMTLEEAAEWMADVRMWAEEFVNERLGAEAAVVVPLSA
ncbi:MAG: hypothetical protein GXP39_17505 [Chloroflexi bacterium]|nr:hypothetical protein [Chloroflexota bacterium]